MSRKVITISVLAILVAAAFATTAVAEGKFKVFIGANYEQLMNSPGYSGTPPADKILLHYPPSPGPIPHIPRPPYPPCPPPYYRLYKKVGGDRDFGRDSSPSFDVKGLYNIWTPSVWGKEVPVYLGLGFRHAQFDGSQRSVPLEYGYTDFLWGPSMGITHSVEESYKVGNYGILFPVEGSISILDWLMVGAGIEGSANYYDLDLEVTESISKEYKSPKEAMLYPRPNPPQIKNYEDKSGTWRFGLGGNAFIDARIYKALHLRGEGGAKKVFGEVARWVGPWDRFELDGSTWWVGGKLYINL